MYNCTSTPTFTGKKTSYYLPHLTCHLSSEWKFSFWSESVSMNLSHSVQHWPLFKLIAVQEWTIKSYVHWTLFNVGQLQLQLHYCHRNDHFWWPFSWCSQYESQCNYKLTSLGWSRNIYMLFHVGQGSLGIRVISVGVCRVPSKHHQCAILCQYWATSGNTRQY